jgi:uncharacterized SAM-binding protein YcdF (DUF218 family)
MSRSKRLAVALWRTVKGVSLLMMVGVLWLAAGGPVGIDGWLDVTEPPVAAEAIVVLGGGTTSDNLPLPQGWERLGTAARLFISGFAPVVIVSGGGTEQVREAEVYANAAAWLGIPKTAMVFEPGAQSTADHGFALRGLPLPNGTVVATDTPLLVVTSRFHSRRALLSFARAGFTRVRVVSDYALDAATREAVQARLDLESGGAVTPFALANSVIGYEPSGKVYNDVLFRLAYRTFDFFIALREVGAVLVS